MNLTAVLNLGSSGVRIFFVIWLGQLISLIGTRLTAFALGYWVYEQTGSATQFMLIAVATALPGILMLPLTGTFVDRMDRRLVLMWSDAGAGACTLIIALLLALGQLQIWHIYVLMAISSAFDSFQWPAYAAASTLLIPKEHYGRAAGMLPLARSIAQTLAPVAGGFLLIAFGLPVVLLIDVLTFALSIGTLSLIRIPMPPKTSEGEAGKGSIWREASYGWRYITTRPGLMSLLLFFAAHNLFLGIVNVLPVPLVASFATVDMMGTIFAAGGIGMLLGSVAMGVWGGPKINTYGIYGFGLMRGLCVIAAGWRPSPVLFALAYGLYFFGLPMMNGCSQAIWQRKVAPDIQGRVFSIRKMIAFSSVPASYFLAGVLAEHVFEPLLLPGGLLVDSVGPIIGTGPGRGIGLLFIVAGILVIVKTSVAMFLPRLRRVEAELPDCQTA
ncbi:MAG: MFS transporter [Candidatus Entotheonella factor]|uniref:MFS transporter n=1 Tax=Entotheonella factor TaxID=1429438 RepID=W4LDC0_ENTF1|nr:MAG: MFS transporter [Candidatus Entotheonella factor]